MFQLVPFFFINQITFAFILFLIILYVFSKHILPRFVRLFLTRVFISKLYSDKKKILLTRFFCYLELGLSSPPKPHSFVSLPKQSFICSHLLFAPYPRGSMGYMIETLANMLPAQNRECSRLSNLCQAAENAVSSLPQGSPEHIAAQAQAASLHAQHSAAVAHHADTLNLLADVSARVIGS